MASSYALVDRAVLGATSATLQNASSFHQFSADLFDATNTNEQPDAHRDALAVLSEETDPKQRRLIAWALMRYLATFGRFPSEPRELRPRALTFIRQNLEHDLKHHSIDVHAQSHELERALSQVVTSIERDLHEATTFHGLRNLQRYQERLLSTLNHRRNAGLLFTFSQRRIVHDALNTCFDAVRSFLQADEPALLDQYQFAIDMCREAEATLTAQDSLYASSLLATAPAALQNALTDQISSLTFTKPAVLNLAPVAKKYPLHAINNEIDIRLELTNIGGGSAYDIQVTIESTNELEILQGHLDVGTLAPEEHRVLYFSARVSEPEAIGLLGATVEWINFDRQADQLILDVDLQAQDPLIDWLALERDMPYTLDVARGDRFIGRTALLNRMIGHVTSPNPRSMYLWGQKRVGKTSLVQALADAVTAGSEDFAVTYLETIREPTAEQTTDAICRRLINQLRNTDDRFGTVPEPPLTGSLSPLSEFLDSLLVIAPDKRFLIILDEFDELPVELYKGRGVADTFFQSLGKGIAGKDRVCVVLVGGERIPAIIRAQGMRLNMYRPVQIDHFDRSTEFGELVRHPGEPLEFSEEAVSALWSYCAGNPYFLNEICSRLAELMVDRRDAHVTADEVEEAIVLTASNMESNSFAHYWDDGFVDVDPEQTMEVQTERIRFLLLVADTIARVGETMTIEDLESASSEYAFSLLDVERMVSDFHGRRILIDDENGYKLRVKLFQEWLRGKGQFDLRNRLWDDLGSQERIEEGRSALVSEDEIADLLANWGTYQGAKITPLRIRQWLGQFGSVQDQRLMFTLLEGVRFFTGDVVRDGFAQAHRIAQAGMSVTLPVGREHRRDVLVSYLGSVGRSGPSIARVFCQATRIWKNNCVPPNMIGGSLGKGDTVRSVAFVDDFVGTGRSAMRQFDEFFEREGAAVESLRAAEVAVSYVVVAGTSDGLNALRRHLEKAPLRVAVVAAHELGDEARAFDASAPMWANASDREVAEEIARSFGQRLEGRGPLGFANTQGLVVFEGNCPNTSLPILYKQRRSREFSFVPLFPRSS